ncbi:MAG: energy transducer TonB, partial [Cytophagales bacterium]
MSEKIIYPPSARQKGVQGTLFITFVVDVKGTIEKSSVKVSWGLNEACDREAVRVVLSNTNRWKSAQKNGVAVRQRFTLPVVFKLTDVEAIERVKWVNPIKTVVAMPSDKRSIGWNVYGDDRVTNKIG